MTEKNYYALFDKPTPQNLEANQRGRLTTEQRSALGAVADGQRSSLIFWGVITLAIVGFMFFFFWQAVGVDGLLSTTSIITIGLVAIGMILLLQVLSGGDFFFIFPRDEIENGQVETVIGKFVWAGGRYKFVSDTRKLKFLRHGRVLPPPGDYRFYCLPNSGLVVMAEELGLISTSQPKDLLLDVLANAHHFSMDDLQTNREGSLSHRQELQLFGQLSMLIGFVLIAVLSVVLAVQGRFLESTPTFLILIGVIILILFLRMMWSVIMIIGDMWEGKVNHTDGRVTRHIHKARNTRYYTYQVNGLKFHVSLSAYNALIEGRGYRVYFTPRAKRLVAIESL